MKLVTKPNPMNNLLLRPKVGATMKMFKRLLKYLTGSDSKMFLRNFIGLVSREDTPLLKYTNMYLLAKRHSFNFFKDSKTTYWLFHPSC